MIDASIAFGQNLLRRYHRLICVAILVFAAAVRCLDLGKSLWSDEANTLLHAWAPDFLAAARINVHPPLYFWLLRQLTLLSHSYAVLRLFSVACGLGTVALFLRVVPGPAALLAGFLVACSPEMTYQSQELRQYALVNLLLAIALGCTLRLMEHFDSRPARWGLALSLAAGAATHLLTGFFLVPLAVILLWSHGLRPVRRTAWLLSLFVPAGLLLIFFNKVFLLAAKNLTQADWWMAPAEWGAVVQGLRVALGWDMIRWTGSAIGRHLAAGEPIFLIAIGVTAGFAAWTAWLSHRSRLAYKLLFVAVGYWVVVIAYSFVGLSVLMPRILIPGVLPLLLSIAVGISEQPNRRRQWMAAGGISLCALIGIAPWLWFFGWVPREDLRGLVTAIQRNSQQGETVIFIGGIDAALDAYWPEFKSSPQLARVNLFDPLAPQFDRLRSALKNQPTPRDVLIAYRVDGYFYPRQALFAEILAFLTTQGLGPPQPVWDYNFYYLIRLPAARAPVAPLVP